MEKVALLWAIHEGRDVSASFSDRPVCTTGEIPNAAQQVNDSLDDDERQKLNAFIPRLLRARRTGSDVRVNMRLSVFAARYVLELTRPRDREVCQRAIDATEAWLAGETTIEEMRTANAAANAAYAANTAAIAFAANAAFAAAANANYAAHAVANAANAAAAAADMDPLTFLDALLDAWEESVTKEGEDLYVPRSWEDDALAFVSEYMSETS